MNELPFHLKRAFDLLEESTNEYRSAEHREHMAQLSKLNAVIAQAAALTRIADALESLVGDRDEQEAK